MRPETLQRGDHVSIRRLEAGDEAACMGLTPPPNATALAAEHPIAGAVNRG